MPAFPSTHSVESVDVGTSADDLDRLRLVLLRLARRIRTQSVGRITPSQLAVLATVNRQGPSTIGQIAEAEHVRPPSISKIVAALEAIDLVVRTDDPDDRRCVLISVSECGQEYLEEVRTLGRTWLAGQLTELDDHEVAAIDAALPSLERLLGGTR